MSTHPKRVGRKSKAKRRVAILSRKRGLYSTLRLIEACKQLSVTPLVIDTLRCSMALTDTGAHLSYRGVPVLDIAAAIPRIGASITAYGVAVVTQLENLKVPVLNGAYAISTSRDKLRCLQVLSCAGIRVPKTVMANRGSSVKQVVDEVGGLPVVIKVLRGTQGVGVMLANTMAEAKSIIETFWELEQDILIQEFVSESKGVDIRALVVGGVVVGAMRRKAKGEEFRANIHRGAEGEAFELPREYAEIAVRAAKAVKLQLAGVDLLEGKEGPKVMELNSSPGFEGLEKATNKDIARSIIQTALSLRESAVS